jgi:hypothetical protein
MMRSLARNMVEPHPFARSPVTMAPHSWRAGDLGKRLVRTSAVYVIPFTLFALHTLLTHTLDFFLSMPSYSAGRSARRPFTMGGCDSFW